MLAVGFLILWGGYSVSLWGWCLLRGYNVTLAQLMNPLHPYGTAKGEKWPPPQLDSTVIFPGKNASTASSGGGSGGGSGTAPAPGANTAPGNPAPSGRIGPGGTVPK